MSDTTRTNDELAAATREHDAAIRVIGEQARLLGMHESREVSLMAEVDSITRERDEARAEVERLRALQERTESVLNATTDAYKYDHDALTADVERLRSGLRIAIDEADGWFDNSMGGWCPSIPEAVRALAATEAK
jgi:hypothetical protein